MQKVLNKEKICLLLKEFNPSNENIINALHVLQDAHPLNYISEEILDEVSSYFKLSKAQVYGIVTYYSMFSVKPRNANIIRLCKSPVCRMMGAEDILTILKNKWNINSNDTMSQPLFTLEAVQCLGRCSKGPSMMVNNTVYTGITEEKLDTIINDYLNKKE